MRGAHVRHRLRRTLTLAPAESVSGRVDDDGRYHLRGELDADHGRIVDSALAEARDALFQAGQTKGDVGRGVGGDGPTLPLTALCPMSAGSGFE